MFENLVSTLVETILKEYVEDSAYSKSSVQLGIMSGFVLLENVVLRKTILDSLKLPITAVYGVVGRVEIRIPWSNITVEPVVCIFDKVYLVVEPKFEFNPNASYTREQNIKQAKLAAAELFTNNSKQNDPFYAYREFARTWLIESLTLKFITNIEVHIREVHIRYEDRESCPTEFCVGLTVESIHIHNNNNYNNIEMNETNDHFNNKYDIENSTKQFNEFFPSANTEQPFNIQGNISNKQFIVNHLSIYWNPLYTDNYQLNNITNNNNINSTNIMNQCTTIFSIRSPIEMEYLLSKTIAKRNQSLIDRPKHHYILHPMDMTTNIAFALDFSGSGVQVFIISFSIIISLFFFYFFFLIFIIYYFKF